MKFPLKPSSANTGNVTISMRLTVLPLYESDVCRDTPLLSPHRLNIIAVHLIGSEPTKLTSFSHQYISVELKPYCKEVKTKVKMTGCTILVWHKDLSEQRLEINEMLIVLCKMTDLDLACHAEDAGRIRGYCFIFAVKRSYSHKLYK